MTTASDGPSRITKPEQYLAALRRVIEALRAKRNEPARNGSPTRPRDK